MKLSSHDIRKQTHQTGRWFLHNEELMSPLLGSTINFKISHSTHLSIETVNHANEIAPSQFFAVRIDDGQWLRWPATQQTITVPLSEDEHQITIMTAGNTDLDDVWFHEQDFAIHSLTVDDQAVIKPVERSQHILVLGDSITAGCWVNGKHASADYRPESNYVGIASDLLPEWEFHRVAYSAAGVLRSGTGNVPPAKAWLANLDAHRVAPPAKFELVVIALGVNDRRYSTEQFTTAYRAYVKEVQARYAAPIALMVPFLQSFRAAITMVGKQLGMPVIQTTDWCPSTTDGLHPDQNGSLVAGRHFAQAIRQLVQ